MRPDCQLEMESCPTNIRPVLFYDIVVLGLKVLYGGENACFSSLQTLGVKDTILNLEKGHVTPVWATSCHSPNQSAKTARFVHYLYELSKPESQEMIWAFLEVEYKKI
jgi:hypothetical protein